MKKFIMVLLLVVCGTSIASAQAGKGLSSFGVNLGYGFDSKNVSFGVDYRYCLTDEIRLSPAITYLIQNDGLSATMIDVNAHYIFPCTDRFNLYPLAGLSLSFWENDLHDNISAHETYIGANVGVGGEVYVTHDVTLGMELKWNIIKDHGQIFLGIRAGYCF